MFAQHNVSTCIDHGNFLCFSTSALDSCLEKPPEL